LSTHQEQRRFDVIGFGVNALDLIAVIDGYPEPDTKVQFQEFDVQGGGVVATAMAACAPWGSAPGTSEKWEAISGRAFCCAPSPRRASISATSSGRRGPPAM
jgi:hypothetical protein